ncbi:hypothetical protein CCZ01_04410 [Helicobacter monodelphidis]|uniref:twin-arginine translocation signal domain-containing protein n=1 Tax=Helicobacter sp. 15-1451 TaxID=2004995 RepID=UPI000DCEC769|nr:twin-arginine translocation signal domain-containing protein [Helicobacter sp. 15-1451]RAX57877.1 hypothetical protein CCZ01_04410 [Helicobacter sp. 15-1451]
MKKQDSTRREFLKKAAKGSVTIAAGAAILTGCSGERLSHLSNKKSKKTEVLYQKSPHWELYYSVAK